MTAPAVRWLGNSDIIRHILTADPNACKPAYSLGPPAQTPAPPGTPVARYRSLAAFQDGLTAATLDPRYHWVLYDPEADTPQFTGTPTAEQQDPWTWLPRFGQYAHAHGYRVIAAPARDLGNVDGSRYPKLATEDISRWYVRTGVVSAAAQNADIVSIQSQALTEDVKAYETFVAVTKDQAQRENPYVKVFAGISTRYGTAAQMAAAARSVHVDGYWLNVPGPAPDIAKAVEFLRLMTGGT